MEDISLLSYCQRNLLELSQVVSHLCSNIPIALHLIRGGKPKMKKLRFLEIDLWDREARKETLQWFPYAQALFSWSTGLMLPLPPGPPLPHSHPSFSFSHAGLPPLPWKCQADICLMTLVILCLCLKCSFPRFHMFHRAQSLLSPPLPSPTLFLSLSLSLPNIRKDLPWIFNIKEHPPPTAPEPLYFSHSIFHHLM